MPQYKTVVLPGRDEGSYVETEVTMAEARIIDLLEEQVAALDHIAKALERIRDLKFPEEIEPR